MGWVSFNCLHVCAVLDCLFSDILVSGRYTLSKFSLVFRVFLLVLRMDNSIFSTIDGKEAVEDKLVQKSNNTQKVLQGENTGNLEDNYLKEIENGFLNLMQHLEIKKMESSPLIVRIKPDWLLFRCRRHPVKFTA